MTASIIQLPSRGGFIRRENAAYESATVAGERMACSTNLLDRGNLARISIRCGSRESLFWMDEEWGCKFPLPAFSVVVRCQSPSSHSLMAGRLEGGANCNAASLPFDAGACADLSNFCRSLTGWSFPRVHLRQKPTHGLYVLFREFLRWLVPVHAPNMNDGAAVWNEKSFPNPTTVLPRMK